MEKDVEKSLDQFKADHRFVIGNDLVFIPNFKLSFDDLFKKKVYTPGEIAYCDQFADPILRYASTWAAKEAVYKAIKQLDESPLGPKSIEISRQKNAGIPSAIIHKPHAVYKISLTISHDGEYVWAIALIEPDL